MNQEVNLSLKDEGKFPSWFKDQMHLKEVASFMRLKRCSTAAHAADSKSLFLVFMTPKAHKILDRSTSDSSGSL